MRRPRLLSIGHGLLSACALLQVATAVAAAEPLPHYIIVTSPELAGSFAELAAHRNTNGYQARVVTLVDVTNAYPGLDLPAGIRSWARDAGLATTNDVLVIGGDQDVVPARLCKPRAGGDVMPADLYFADMGPGTWDTDDDGNFGEGGELSVSQLSPLIAVGRIPVRTPEHAMAYIAKLLRYESAAGTEPSCMLLVGGGNGITGTARPPEFRYHESVGGREIAQMTLYWNRIQPWWHAGPLHWLFESASTWDQSRYGDYPLTRNNLMARLNEPHLYVSYSGHSNRKRWFVAAGQNLSRDDLFLLTNTFPFINLPGGCGTCYHDDVDDPCMSEAALRNPLGGAVVWFGFVRSTGGGQQRESLIEYLFQMRGATLGQAHAAMLRALAPGYVGDPYEQFNIVLQGDPALRAPSPPTGQNLDLFCPRGAEIVAVGDPFVIRWNAWGTGFATNEHVRLDYSADETTWQVVPGAEALPFNARAHAWDTTGLPASRSYRLRISSVEHPGLLLMSPPFSIVPTGLLVVRANPVPALRVGGSQGNTTDYDISVSLGDTARLIAPEVQGLQFEAWRDGAAVLLSTNASFSFTFTTNSTCVATYTPLQETVYYVNDDIAEYGIAPGDDANDGLTPLTPVRTIQGVLDRYPSAGYGAVVFVSEGTFEENLILTLSHAGLVLRGAGRTLTIIDGARRGSCVDAQAWQLGRLEHLGFENGLGMTHGGAIQMSGASLMVVDCLFDGNTAQNKGGAIYTSESWADCDLTVQDSEFVDNNAIRGGVIYTAKAARVAMSNCVFRGNFSALGGGGGGAFQIGLEGSIELTDCTFEDNSTPDSGGAIRHSSSRTSVIQRCQFTGNSAGTGGAVHVSGTGGIVLNGCTFSNNLASGNGGAVAVEPAASEWPLLSFRDCQFLHNGGGNSGGAIRAEGGNLAFSSCLFSSNHAAKAGVLSTAGSPSVSMQSCRLEYNSADYSGVMRLTGVAPQVRCTDCEIVNNSATHEGGVLNAHAASLLELNRCHITGNYSDTGGALRIRNSATVRATDCLLARNRATVGLGGAVYAYEAGSFQAVACTLADNESADKGGALAWSSTGALTLTNSILFQNRALHGSENLYQASSGTVHLANLCTTPVPTNGFGHITNAPLFVDYAIGDLRLQSNSPCINAGLNTGVSNAVDLDGLPRVVRGTVDLGAYEFQGPGSVISYAWLQQYGLPTDGSADFAHSDSDPLNNWQEWVALTIPTNAASCFHIDTISRTPPVMVSFASAPGRLYTLMACTNLAQGAWTAVSALSEIPGTGEMLQLMDTNLASAAYYRVGIRLP